MFIIIIITSQDKLVSPYHGSSAELVLIGVELGTLGFQAEVITHYTTAPQLIDYMSPEFNAPRDTAMHNIIIIILCLCQ